MDFENCSCKSCDPDGVGSVRIFLKDLHKRSHYTSQLLWKCPETVTLRIGRSRTPLVCHKALLGFHSQFFEGMLYGNFAESNQVGIEVPDEEEDSMKSFEGFADRELSGLGEMPERLWVLGNKLIATMFANDAMDLIRRKHEIHYLDPNSAVYVYENTVPESKFWQFIKDLIFQEGPLNLQKGSFSKTEAWANLLAKGGELAKDCINAVFDGSTSVDAYKRPYNIDNFPKYLESKRLCTASDWIKSKQEQKK